MSKSDIPKYVTALFSFKGKNNDELCFKKGDVITITQTDEEGWWEGTLHDKTGWFPSNYVKECRATDVGLTNIKTSPEKSVPESPIHQKLNRDIVLKDIVDSEKVNIAELQGLLNNFLHPLESANVLNKEDYKQLLSNVHEVLEVHQRLLTNLETAVTQGSGSRIGNIFLTLAPRMKSIHTSYCGNHPRAVCILDRYRDELNEFMERNGAISPGILVLTTGLSKPFRRLDKYSAMLQELERYTEKNHPDRGDTQRSIAVYREITDRCASIRKQRELALQVLTSGIKGWEGEELNSLGEILYVGSVTLASGATGLDRRDRYFVLFQTTLLVLSASPRMSSFVYEGKLPLTGISITQTENTDDIRNAFEITGPMIESILVLCATREDQQRWIELLTQEQTTCSTHVKSTTTSRVSYDLPPYTRLSKYFAKLVRKKLIRPEMLKKLLYLQYVLKPDLSNVKMRRSNVTTYALYPMRTSSSQSRSNDSETMSFQACEPRREQEHLDGEVTSVLRKSTLTLDVKYAVDLDLSTVGIENDCSVIGEFVSGRDDNTRSEISKSLPIDATLVNNDILINYENQSFPIHDSRTNDLSHSFPNTRHRFGNRKYGYDDAVTIRINQIASTREQPIANSSAVHHSIISKRNKCLCETTSSTRRSSDSGMAESYRFNSSEVNSSCKSCTCVDNKYDCLHLPRRESFAENENDENKFAYQCICTSPFDSTPRDSANLSDLSKNIDEISASLIPNTIASSNETRGQATCQSDVNMADERENVCLNKSELATEKRFTQPIPYEHQFTVSRKVGRKSQAIQPIDPPPVIKPDSIDYGTSQVYTSGLYAHWWLKKSIPSPGHTNQAMLCEIRIEQNWKHQLLQQQQLQSQPQQTQQQQRSVAEHGPTVGIKTPWSIASIRPAPPLYNLRAFGKSETSLDLSRTPRQTNERQFEEDAIILKVIEAYCLSVNARFTVHSGESTSMLDYDSHKSRDRISLMHNRANWEFCSNRILSETVKTLKCQMTDLQSQMSLLTKQLDEERRSRLSLAATVKRSMGVVDGSVP